MKVRKATVADAHAIAEVHVRSVREGFAGLMPAEYLSALSISDRAASWHERIACGEAPTLIESEDPEPADVAGFTLASASREDDLSATIAEVRLFYVHPRIWGRGYGTALWRREARQLSQQGFSSAILWVLSSNAAARRFYERLGFGLDRCPPRQFREANFMVPQVRYSMLLR